jgi:hypothetical protein
MNLYTICNSCKESIKIKSGAAARPDLQMEKGDEFNINCQKCGKIDKVHVNDVKAEPNKQVLIIGLVTGIFFSAFLWFFYGAIAAICIAIPYLFWQQQMNAIKSFNSYMIRRK